MENGMTIDCWDFKGCPEEKKNSCLAFKHSRGKDCWISTGNFYCGKKQENASKKLEKCRKCSFYIKAHEKKD